MANSITSMGPLYLLTNFLQVLSNVSLFMFVMILFLYNFYTIIKWLVIRIYACVYFQFFSLFCSLSFVVVAEQGSNRCYSEGGCCLWLQDCWRCSQSPTKTVCDWWEQGCIECAQWWNPSWWCRIWREWSLCSWYSHQLWWWKSKFGHECMMF